MLYSGVGGLRQVGRIGKSEKCNQPVSERPKTVNGPLPNRSFDCDSLKEGLPLTKMPEVDGNLLPLLEAEGDLEVIVSITRVGALEERQHLRHHQRERFLSLKERD